jgi:HD-GYP domain-containing protein (c-di-GMP phosphodiesterase class II)
VASSYREFVSEEFVPLAVDALVEDHPLPFDIFTRDNGIMISLFNKGNAYDASASAFLREKGIREVLVKDSEAAALERYLANKTASPAPAPAAASVFPEYFACKEQYYLIDKTLLATGTTIGFPIYILNRSGLMVFIDASEKAGCRLEQPVEDVDGDLVIRRADIPPYQAYLNALLIPDSRNAAGAGRIRALVVKEDSKLLIKDLIDNPRSGEKIKESINAVNSLVDCILENREALSVLVSIRTHDMYTYTHSVNVAALAVGLGMEAGLSRSELEYLGIGTMLHDLGKNCIPLEILNKQGRLTDEEFRIMKSHVLESEKILRDHKDIPPESLVAALQHHEKISGKGYPYGISGSAVKTFGRISAIADTYDALTTQRSYKAAFTPFHALSILVKETGNYDPELLTTFIKMLGKVA